MKNGKTPKIMASVKGDWCHLCGQRQKIAFAEFSVPKNAEHSTADEERGYFRICKNCIGLMHDAVNGA